MAATIKQRARGLIRAISDVLADKSIPKTLRDQIEALSVSLKKTWSELEADADHDPVEALKESANMGAWLESRIHSMFTNIADDMYGNGKLTREERMALNHAIGQALDTFIDTVLADAPQIYTRSPWQDVDEEPQPVQEAEASLLESAPMPLLEKAVRADGTIGVKIIAPGWGSSGYYPAEVLQRDGPKVFISGLKMYWNHPTPTEEAERPERDLRDLAAELVSPARWVTDHPAGPGLYADAKVFEAYQPPVDDLAQHIGVSIRAIGKGAPGSAEGRQGNIIQEITAARSVDFVTTPGAGGEVLTLFEAARGGGAAKTQTEEGMTKEEIEAMQAENKRLKEEVETLKKGKKEADEAKEAAATEAARLREARALTDAAAVIQAELDKFNLPETTRKRLAESLNHNLPLTEAGVLDKGKFGSQVQESAKSELTYLASALGLGDVRGMGSSTAGDLSQDFFAESQKRLEANFREMGMSESAAKIAATGRQ